MEALIVGGFASTKWYYLPLRWALAREGYESSFVHEGVLGLNVWPMEYFLACADRALERTKGDVFVIGHSLGGIQGINMADLYPDRVKRVFTIGTPVWGCALETYERYIRTLMNVPESELQRFRNEVVPRNAHKIVTISCENDHLAPRDQCVIDGSKNYVLAGEGDELSSSSHLLLPYVRSTIDIITHEIRQSVME